MSVPLTIFIDTSTFDEATVSGVIKLKILSGGTVIDEVQGVKLDQKDFTISSRLDEYR